MLILAQIVLYTVLSGLFSLIGGIVLLGNPKLVQKFGIHFISFAAGTLLATAFFDLLPEAFSGNEDKILPLLGAALAGMVAFFLFELLLLKFHSHVFEDNNQHRHAVPTLLMAGDAMHNFIDGVAIAISFIADARLGLLTALAVAAHEWPQEIGDFSVLIHHGWEKRKVILVNIYISLTSVAGGLLAYFFRDLLSPLLPYLLAVTAGNFIFIAASDLIPQITASDHVDRPSHIISLLLAGIFVLWFVSRLLGV